MKEFYQVSILTNLENSITGERYVHRIFLDKDKSEDDVIKIIEGYINDPSSVDSLPATLKGKESPIDIFNRKFSYQKIFMAE